jgi:hypothetical protein
VVVEEYSHVVIAFISGLLTYFLHISCKEQERQAMTPQYLGEASKFHNTLRKRMIDCYAAFDKMIGGEGP